MQTNQSKDKKSNEIPPTFIKSPQSLSIFTATARCIMDELRDKHKAIEQSGMKKMHPSELITIEKIPSFLVKYSNLSEQAKSTEAIDQSLSVLTDSNSNGKDRYLYLYPYLIKSGNKITAKIAMISPQNAHEVDATPYRQACFEFSKSMVDLIISSRSKKAKEIKEEDPGEDLFQKNKQGNEWLNPEKFSIESEVNSLIKSGFKPYKYLPIKDFITDFIEYGNSKNALEEILPNYHLIIDEIQLKEDGSYIRQPEIVTHYRAQADGLEKFAMTYFPKLAESMGNDAKQMIHDYKFHHKDAALPGRKQNREKVKALIELVRNFPFSQSPTELSKQVKETCDISVRILLKLMENMENIIQRKYSSIERNLLNQLKNRIGEFTKTNMVLCPIDLKKEIEQAGIKETEKIKDIAGRLETELKKSYGIEKIPDGNHKFYVVDQSYMASVLHKYGTELKSDTEAIKEYEIAKKINEEMISTQNPRLNINLDKGMVNQLETDLLNSEKAEKDKEKDDFFKNKFNMIAFLIVLALGVFISFLLYSSNDEIESVLVGLPLSTAIAFFAGLLTKKRPKEIIDNSPKKPVKPLSLKEETKEDKMNMVAKASMKYIYPAAYSHITEKVYTQQSLKDKISKHVDEIKLAVPLLREEKDLQKISSTIEHSILNSSIVIAIPPELLVPNKPSSYIINKNDFKAPLYRGQLAEFYRKEMEKSKVDKSLVEYYRFIVNTLEIDYPKYLNKKIR
jgi:hypothetical protein